MDEDCGRISSEVASSSFFCNSLSFSLIHGGGPNEGIRGDGGSVASSVFLWIRYRWLGCALNCITLSSGLGLPVSETCFLPPNASISRLTTAIHESISSALSRTSSKLVADLR